MPTDLVAWRRAIQQTVDGIADEGLQRRAWFGLGPEVSSPDEAFNALLGDAAIDDFLQRKDTGLSDLQMEAGRNLARLMRDLSTQTPIHIDPTDLIDDPRWKSIRQAATLFSALLESDPT